MFCVSNAQDSKQKDYALWDYGDSDDDVVNEEEDVMKKRMERKIKRWEREKGRYMRMMTDHDHVFNFLYGEK